MCPSIAAQNNIEMDAPESPVWETTDELRRIIDALPFLVCFIDLEWTLRFCNKHFEEWFQKPLGQLEGRALKEIYAPGLFRSVRTDIERGLSGRRFSSEATLAFPDGVSRSVRRTYIPCTSSEGELFGCFSLVQDVTEAVESQAGLGREKDLFEGVFRALPAAVALLGAKRKIVLRMPAPTDPLGYRPDEGPGGVTKFLYHGRGQYERRNLTG